jgi:heterodisulfide reductase subunit C
MGYLNTMRWLASDRAKHAALATAWVLPEPSRCVQCGICTFCCPVEIDVRRHVWRGEPVSDPHCLTCGECVKRCPRGLLRMEAISSPDSARLRRGAL